MNIPEAYESVKYLEVGQLPTGRTPKRPKSPHQKPSGFVYALLAVFVIATIVFAYLSFMEPLAWCEVA